MAIMNVAILSKQRYNQPLLTTSHAHSKTKRPSRRAVSPRSVYSDEERSRSYKYHININPNAAYYF